MKILVIGDPHGSKNIKKIPIKKINPDLILITGDIGRADVARKRFFKNIELERRGLPKLEEDIKYVKNAYGEIHKTTLEILKYLSKFAQVYTIQGNVGITTKSQINETFEKFGVRLPYTLGQIQKMKNVHLVKNQIRNINGLRIGFLEHFTDMSWIKEFKEKNKDSIKGAKKDTKKAKRILKRFANLKIDLLVCHQPPYGILDKVKWDEAPKHYQGKHAGSKVILDYIKKYQPKYVICGHIHEGKGRVKLGKTEIINAGCCGDYFEISID